MTRTARSARLPTCRRAGCGRGAGPDGLCEHHARAQAARRALVVAAAAQRGRAPNTGRDLLAAFLRTIEVREAPWRAEAACRGAGPARFFPVRESGGGAADYAEAIAFCARCPVVDACRAAGAEEPAGVWGGEIASRRRRRTSRAA